MCDWLSPWRLRRWAGRTVRDLLKEASFKLFIAGDRLGIHILPKHYYSPVPDVMWLRDNQELWARPASFDHIRWDLEEQLGWISTVSAPYYDEVKGWDRFRSFQAEGAGPGFGPVESQLFHCIVRHYRPRRIVEVGSGMSTLCALYAGTLNSREGAPAPQVTCIEPFPWPGLLARDDVQLIQRPLQAVSQGVFEQLGPGDLLFFDSSHSVKVGSELPRLYLEVIPSLAPGVLVHVHDIFFPYLFPRDVLSTFFGWQESTLLLALLTHNPCLEVLTCMSALHYERSQELQRVLTDYVPRGGEDGLEPPHAGNDQHFPSSIYLVTRQANDAVAEGDQNQIPRRP